MNLIFAVTDDQTNLYKELGKHIEGSKCGTLSNNSANVVTLVEDQYEVSYSFRRAIESRIINVYSILSSRVGV